VNYNGDCNSFFFFKFKIENGFFQVNGSCKIGVDLPLCANGANHISFVFYMFIFFISVICVTFDEQAKFKQGSLFAS
jgi:hypothetical protein